MENIDPQIFKAYDVRGIYPGEIDQELAYRIGLAYALYLKKDLRVALPAGVVLGLDMRGSSPFLAKEISRGLIDSGIDVIEIGKVPTPAFYYAVAFKGYSAGVMVTASHNPKQYNGFKFCGPKAIPIGLNSGLGQIRDYTLSSELAPERRTTRGKFSSLPDISREYVSHDLSYINVGNIKKFKIVADTANCMGAVYLSELFQRVPAELIKVNWDLNGNMPSHEANPIKPENMRQLQEILKSEHADFGIATDGDGDRIGFVDEKADIIPPDAVIALVAQALLRKHPGARIGYDLRCSRVVKEIIESAGGVAVQTPVGHSHIKKIMKDQDVLFSGELSCHYYFRENYNFESPVFVIAALLSLRSQADKPFSEMWRPLIKYFHSGEINFEVSDKETAMQRLEKKYAVHGSKVSKLDGLKIEYPDWWFNIRSSNTESLLRLNLEAEDKESMTRKLTEITTLIEQK